MRYIADLHIHSHYSRATSPDLNLEHLFKWAQLKGLNVVATGDLTHPLWLEEMREKLQESAAGGLYTLKETPAAPMRREIPAACANNVYYILSGEISNIYKKDGKVRKVHNVVLFPSLESVELFQRKLERIGNIRSDGRPILGLDSRDLLEMVLETDPRAVLIPAHIWTPWFSLLGSKSGFDSVQECYSDLSEHIFALETGLSSDPPMNWRLSILDQYNLVSNSDAHSPAKLAREANVFNTEIGYDAMIAALKNRTGSDFWGTIEFFPEEGKYHVDGHRKCGCMTLPKETMQNKGLCPVCGKPSTLGVSYRIEELADRPEGAKPANAKLFTSLIPLPEVIAQVKSCGVNSKSVQTMYIMLLRELGSELTILMDTPIADLEKAGGSLLAEAVRRMRAGEVSPVPGYDGEYGVIRIFKEDERKTLLQQGQLFGFEGMTVHPKPAQKKASLPVTETPDAAAVNVVQDSAADYGLNEEQLAAVQHRGAPLIIQAGPGAGKTRTLTQRIAGLIASGLAQPQQILAVTFTNKAATEMRDRLFTQLGKELAVKISIKTFHAFGADLLRQTDLFFGRTRHFTIINTTDDPCFKTLFRESYNLKLTQSALDSISALKSQGYYPDGIPKEIKETLPEQFETLYKNYEHLLRDTNSVDYDDLICLALLMLRKDPDLRRRVLQNAQFLAVDEFQDINRVQYEMFVILAVAAQDVCVIGDPDQAIYGFRGASPEFFSRFANDFPNAVAMKLRRNYRSAQNIVLAARQILDSQERDEADAVWSNIAPEVKVNLHSSPTDRAEAEYIVHTIEQLIGGVSFFSMDSSRVDERGLPQSYSFADIAVLLRTRSLAPPLVEALARSGIPFETFDDSRLTAQERMAFIASSLRWMQNPFEESIQYRELALCFTQTNTDTTAAQSQTHPEFQAFQIIVQAFPSGLPVCEYLEKIWKFAVMLYPGNPEDDRQAKRKLLELAAPFAERLDNFADALALHSVVDDYDSNADKIHILTLHAAKGLEFPVVFIPGCEETIIPYRQPGRHADVDEEKRLLYVGMTRAQRQLYLSHSKNRTLFGQTHSQTPSRFLAGISASLLNREKAEIYKKKKDDQLKLF